MQSRGLKLLLKALAAQRNRFAAELRDMLAEWDRNAPKAGGGLASLVGSLLGAVLGGAAGLTLLIDPDAGRAVAAINLLFVIGLLTLLFGLTAGALFGAMIGVSTTEEDVYIYEQTVRNGKALLYVQTSKEQIGHVRRIMARQRRQETLGDYVTA